MWFRRRKKENDCCKGSESVDISCTQDEVDSLHQREKDDFHRLLAQTGEVLPENGNLVLDCFLGIEGHISPEFIQEKLAEAGHSVDLDTVRDVLEVLCRYGIAQRTQLNGSGAWYEHLHLGGDHDHLLCTGCGKIVEFNESDIGELTKRAARQHGFEPVLHKLTVLGLCSSCRKKEVSAMPLSMAAVGEKVKIVSFSGGKSVRGRLQDMGLVVGDEVEVLNKSGPMILSVKGSRLAVGLGLAQKIMVRPES